MPLEWMPVGQRPTEEGWYWCATSRGVMDMIEARIKGAAMRDQEGDVLIGEPYDKCRFAGPVHPPAMEEQDDAAK